MKVRSLNSAKSVQTRVFSRNLSRQPLPNSWKVARYWDNSGTQNPIIQKHASEAKLSSIRTLANERSGPNWPIRSFDCVNNSSPGKPFTSNSESSRAWNPKYPKASMINYQARDYNLINHTVSARPEVTITNRQKGFGEYMDSARPYKKEFNSDYQEVLKNNPKVFHKQTGVFTMHQDNCVKLSGFGPFHKALS